MDRVHRPALLFALVVTALLGTSCYPGIYGADIFPEMHYQAWNRPYEPDRLSAPGAAVPISGRIAEPATVEAAADLTNPYAKDQQATQRGEQRYAVNCAACHGKAGRGDGLVASYFKSANLTPPADFASARTRSMADGQLFFVLTNGFGNMPSFRYLLTADERWSLVSYIRNVQVQIPAS